MQAWLWAHSTYTSRCFPRRVCSAENEGTNADQAKHEEDDEDEDGVLIPMVDFLNHDHDSCKLELRDGKAILRGSVKKGNEIFYSYGVKPNLQLLLTYGFCMWDNPYETVKLSQKVLENVLNQVASPSLPTASGSSLAQARNDITVEGEEVWRKDPLMRQLRASLESALFLGASNNDLDDETAEQAGLVSISNLEPLPAILMALGKAVCLSEIEFNRVKAEGEVTDGDLMVSWLGRTFDAEGDSEDDPLLQIIDVVEEILLGTWQELLEGFSLEGLDTPTPNTRTPESSFSKEEAFEAECINARSNGAHTGDCLKVGEHEYATTPRGCQLAFIGSQVKVLSRALDSAREMRDAVTVEGNSD